MANVALSGTYTGPVDANGFKVVLTYSGSISDTTGTGSITFTNTLFSTNNNFSAWTISSWIKVNGTNAVSNSSQKTLAKNSSLVLNTYTWSSPGYTGTNYPTLKVQSFADAVTNATYVPVNDYAPSAATYPTGIQIAGFPTVATTYAVTYDSASGTPTPTGGSYAAGATFTAASAPTRSGYTFNYWTGSNGTNYAAGATVTMPSAALTLTASWSVIYVPTPAPGAPTGLSVSGQTTARITLSWTASTGTVSNYGLYKDGTLVTTVTSSTLTYTYTGLSANTPYSLGVRANGPDYSSSITSINGTTLPNTFTTPNVVGQSQATATTTLTNAGFGTVTPTLITAGATAVNNLLVISQTPLSGTTATTGATATVNVYNYLLSVPNVIGLSDTAASTALINAGFTNKTSALTTVGATVANNLTVISTNPTAGTQYNIASNVVYTLANFLTAVPNIVGLGQDAAISSLTSLGFTTVNVTLTQVGVTPANAGTIKSQTPVNSATTYNPKNQAVDITVYSLGITGRRYTGTGFSSLTTAKRFNGSSWVQLAVQKRFNGTSWIDIAN